MGIAVHIKPKEAWQFFDLNRERLAKMQVAIAENDETEYAVYMTEDKECPLISVWRGEGQKIYEEPAISSKDLEDTLTRIYLKYLLPVVIETPKKVPEKKEPELPDNCDLDPELEAQILQDEIYEREDELQLATEDYLLKLLCCPDYETMSREYGNFVSELLDRVCEILSEEFLISIYRPRWVLHEDTGCEEFVCYPYDNNDAEDDKDRS